MTIEVINRGFTLRISNTRKKTSLAMKVSENQMGEIQHFLMFNALGFTNLRGDNLSFSASHKVSTKDGTIEASSGKILFEIIDGAVTLTPFNGTVSGYKFNVTLAGLVQALIPETKYKGCEDRVVGSVIKEFKAGDDQQLYVYEHPFSDHERITITDRLDFYATARVVTENGKSRLAIENYFITDAMWYKFATKEEKAKLSGFKNYGAVLYRYVKLIERYVKLP